MNHIEYLTIIRNDSSIDVQYIRRENFDLKFHKFTDLFSYLHGFCKMLQLENEPCKYVEISVPGYPVVVLNSLELCDTYVQDNLSEVFQTYLSRKE